MKQNPLSLGSSSSRRWRLAGLAALALVLSGASAWADPAWHEEVNRLTALFDSKIVLGGMKSELDYFRLVFTALGYGAVMISVIRKVAKARGGEESMGWVASLVMTVALMATGPSIGEKIYTACDSVAAQSKYDRLDTIKTCWNALLVILPNESPVQDVLNDASQDKDLAKNAPVQKQDASWTKLAWTWMKMAWSTMTNALDKIGTALHAVANQILVMVLLFIPTAALLIGMVFLQLGSFIRELLHQSMDVFLPMMIAMLSFAPMRGAASNFIIKYISVAFWPVAWALGNAIACSILISVMQWVAAVSQKTLESLSGSGAGGAPPLEAASAGYLAGAAAAMPWGLLQVIVLVITLTSLLIIASAIGAPLALTATMTKGASFASAQLGQAASAASTAASAVATGGASLAVPSATAGLASSGAGFLATAALRASSSVGLAAARLAPLGARGGPAGVMASMGASVLSSTSRAMSSLAGAASSVDSEAAAEVPVRARTSPRISMMNTAITEGSHSDSTPAVAERPKTRSSPASVVARSYRRTDSAIEP